MLQELAWDTQVDASAIGVAAKEGAVTLTGFIDSYAGTLAAERAAKSVHGVRAVANDIQVRLRLDRTDEEIAGDAAHALALRASLPAGVQAAVHGGHVTLIGTVSSLFQRAVAERAIHDIMGVKQIVNRIEIKPGASARSIQREIVRALHRAADVQARQIEVKSPEIRCGSPGRSPPGKIATRPWRRRPPAAWPRRRSRNNGLS